MKKLLIIQPAKLGDLIILTPVAKYYSEMGYCVEWATYDNFLNYFKAFDFIKPISFNCGLNIESYLGNNKSRYSMGEKKEVETSLNYFKKVSDYIRQNKFELILDVAWGFAGCKEENLKLIPIYHSQNKNWIHMKYDLCGVPLKNRWDFSWKRNLEKEEQLLDIIQKFSYKKYGTKNFNLIHNYSSNLNSIQLKNKIDFIPIPGFEIYDWYKVLLESDSISCVDSSLCNFIEVLPELNNKTKYYLGSEEPHFYPYMRNILFNNWLDKNSVQIKSDYLGKI